MNRNDQNVHLADTMESPSKGGANNSPLPDFKRLAVGLIEGSSPNLSQEIDAVLNERLRVASLLMFGGFAAFLIKQIAVGIPWETPAQIAMFCMHVAVTVITALAANRLCYRCKHALKHLRAIELVVFVSSAIFLALVTYVRTTWSAEEGFVQSISGPWILLIFTYALFIPNRWTRAVLFIVPMAAAPIIVLLSVRLTSSDFLRLLTSDPVFQYAILESAMTMTLSAAIAMWGIRNMTLLRRQAFEAKQLGNYQLKQRIGTGGMGEVYIGEHQLLRRPCAIKLIHPEKAGDPRALARFEREVQSTAQLTHWNTVDIYDYGRADDGTFYYVMEYLPGMNLQELVEKHGPLPAGRVIHLLKQTCDALSEAHAAGMVHRDIKPANIFAARRGNRRDVAKLLDFGLVRQNSLPEDASLTNEHTLLGSPLYMSPEQAAGEEMDLRSDIYSLGAVAYTLLTGRPPFEGDRPIQVILAHAQSPPPSPSSLVADVPADLEAVVLKALAKSTQDRFQTAREFHDALAACESDGQWDWDRADQWWRNNGCPKKRRLEEAIQDGELSQLGEIDMDATIEQSPTSTAS